MKVASRTPLFTSIIAFLVFIFAARAPVRYHGTPVIVMCLVTIALSTAAIWLAREHRRGGGSGRMSYAGAVIGVALIVLAVLRAGMMLWQ